MTKKNKEIELIDDLNALPDLMDGRHQVIPIVTGETDEPMEEVTERGLTIYGKKDAIYIESTLEHEATVIIYGLSGQVIAQVKVQPMTKEVVTVPSRGVYIVNKRKVAVL